MAKEKIGIRFSARAEADLNIQTENESPAVLLWAPGWDEETRILEKHCRFSITTLSSVVRLEKLGIKSKVNNYI